MRRPLLAGLVLSAFAGCAHHRPWETGDCVPDGGRIGAWSVESTGFGCVTELADASGRWLQASTNRAPKPSQTHAFLLTGPSAAAPFTFSARMRTDHQTRDGSPPNSWETAWLVWNFTDRKHFYYFAAKRDGWELGKRDPAYRGGQRFLSDGRSPSFPLGSWAEVTVTQTAEHRILVHVDGTLVTDFTDVQHPYEKGKIGLYGEDCSAKFADVTLRPAPDATPAPRRR